MIELKQVSKRHGSAKPVFEDVNITIPSGRSVGLLGDNGAGKSTLLRIIGGMDKPTTGEVRTEQTISWPIGLSGGLNASMTGRQNARFIARMYGGKNRIDEIISYVEEFSDLGLYFDKPVKSYSSGMRSRLSFGLSLAIDFDVYLSDEATAVGDFRFKDKATREFKSRVGRSSLIIVSHSVGILRDLCQSGILMREGTAVWYDDIDDALKEYYGEEK